MILYCDHITTRLKFSAQYILRNIFGEDFTISNDLSEIDQSVEVISYSNVPVKDSYHIYPSGLLSETSIRNFEPEIVFSKKIPLLFPVNEGDFPFDIFSAVFWLISRYEEYLEFVPDKHGRFIAKNSFAFRHSFLEIPVVNIWIRQLTDSLNEFFPDLDSEYPVYKFLPTLDIDTAWLVRNKSFIRTAGGLTKLILNANFSDFNQRLKILRGLEEDPFNTYEYIKDFHRNGDLRIFILAGDGGRYNLNNPVGNPEWRSLVMDLNYYFTIGLHPSYYSTEKKELLLSEKALLENLTHNEITISRQHFLRLKFPLTYRRLIEAGIKEDFSMVYADLPGFRAGTSLPFNFYDLEKEEETSLLIYPCEVMDRTLKDYLRLNPENALKRIQSMIDFTIKYGGYFISVWHNDSLSDTGEWKGWRGAYEKIVEYAQNGN